MCVSSDLPVPPRRHERHVSEGCKSSERVGRLPRCDGEVRHLDSEQSLFFARLKFRCRAPLLVISFIAPGSGDPRRVPFMSSHVQIKNLPLRAAPARGFRRRPRRWLHGPLHRPRRPLRASVSVSWAASRRVTPRAGSALVNAAVKAAACFQLLNGDDIFRCHPNPRLIPLLLTSFQSLVWSPAAFRIFPLGYFCRPLTAVRLHPTAAILQLRRLPRSLSDARLIVPEHQS